MFRVSVNSSPENIGIYSCADDRFCHLEEKHITNVGETYW